VNLKRTIATALHPNEAARLRCQMSCPEAESCAGLEALMLEKLTLLGKTKDGFSFSELGKDVSSEVICQHDMQSPPILIGQYGVRPD